MHYDNLTQWQTYKHNHFTAISSFLPG